MIAGSCEELWISGRSKRCKSWKELVFLHKEDRSVENLSRRVGLERGLQSSCDLFKSIINQSSKGCPAAQCLLS